MSYIDLAPILKDYEGKWVALSEDDSTVYGAGETAKAAVNSAESRGYTDYTLLYVQPFDTHYCGLVIVNG